MALVSIFEAPDKLELSQPPTPYLAAGKGGYFTLKCGRDTLTIHYQHADEVASILMAVVADLHQQTEQPPATDKTPVVGNLAPQQ